MPPLRQGSETAPNRPNPQVLLGPVPEGIQPVSGEFRDT
jgi:hypothetical protein